MTRIARAAVMARGPAVVAAGLVALAAFGPASPALAHQISAAHAGGQSHAAIAPGGQSRTAIVSESRGPAQSGSPRDAMSSARLHGDHPGSPDRPTIGAGLTGSGAASGDLAGGLAAAIAAGLIAALVGLGAAPVRRGIIASFVTLALAVLAFETGVHSVHHLGDEAGAARCSVSLASTHLAGTPEEGPGLRVPVVAPVELSPFRITPVVIAPFRCEAPRGPPTPLA